MKKSLLIAVALISITFTSCKKDWTCSCDDGNGGTSDITISSTTKPLAKTACEGYNGSIRTGCKLK